MGDVVIGMDPHKRSATTEIMAGDETVLGGGRYLTDAAGYRAMLTAARQWLDRPWAIEGCQGIGGQVVDVPPKLSARARVFSTGQGRKTDATDAHSVALVATRMAGLRRVVDDEQLAVLRLLADRRRSLGEEHTRMISRLHRLLLELIPRRREEGPLRSLGEGAAGRGPAAGRGRQDAAAGRRRADQRPGSGTRGRLCNPA